MFRSFPARSRFVNHVRSRGPRRRTSADVISAIEILENRQLLTMLGTIGLQPATPPVNELPQTDPLPIDFNSTTGRLTLTGDAGANTAAISIDRRGTASTLDDQLVASINHGSFTHVQRFALADVNEIIFVGQAGNDRCENLTGIQSTMYGGVGSDMLFGGSGTDTLFGGDDADALYGQSGSDVIFGGQGNDYISGSYGNDALDGDGGNDTIVDVAYNAYESISINGGDDADTIYGYGDFSSGEIMGGAGDDTISAFGRAIVFGGTGHDMIHGTVRNDFLYGQAGNDTIVAGAGNDFVHAGDGDDWVWGGAGHDSILGHNGVDILHGDDGYDFLYGGHGNDALFGGAHDDFLFGGDGVDYIYGEAGNDALSGGYVSFDLHAGISDELTNVSDWDDDYLQGGAGSDTFLISDKKLFGGWHDTAFDATSADKVIYLGWFTSTANGTRRWGHLYGT